MLGVKIRHAEDDDAKLIEDMVGEWLKWKIERVKTFREAILRETLS